MMIVSWPPGQLSARSPSSATSTIASGRNGITRNQSSTAVRPLSIHPPEKPETIPMKPPITADTSAAQTPTVSEMRVPSTSSEYTSRPFSSVPSGWNGCNDGGCMILLL